MAEDDEFEMLLKSFDDKNCSDIDSDVDSKDISDIIDEIDSFLEEDGKIEDNKDIDQKPSIVPCSNIGDKQKPPQSLNSDSSIPVLFPITPPPPASPPTATTPRVCSHSDPLDKHYSELAPILADLPDDQARPVEQVGDGLDYSLLDKEEWEDEWEMSEFTMSDILSELKDNLLDDTDEEEEEASSVVDTLNGAEQSHQKGSEKIILKEDFESLKSRSKVTEARYYQALEDVWNIYKDEEGVGPVPARSMMTRPRIFKDKTGSIVGYETLQEYVDNNHPLWGPHRELFNQFLFKERSRQDLVKLVSKNWGNQIVNTARNLTFFSRSGHIGGGKAFGEKGKGVKPVEVEKVGNIKEGMKSAKDTLVEMYANSENVDGVQENERVRAKLYEAQLRKKLLEVQAAKSVADECDLCGAVCVCVVGRKRAAEEGGRVTKQQCLDAVQSWRTKQGWSNERIAEAMFGVMEAFELQSSYSDEPFFSKEQVSELTSFEDVHGMILDMYDSPYKNKEEEICSWSQEDIENF